MNHCTLTEDEMQEIEEDCNEKLLKLFDDLEWKPAVGDLVCEKHGGKTIGLITGVDERNITVHWQRPSQNNVSGNKYETLHVRYLELIKEHQSSSSE